MQDNYTWSAIYTDDSTIGEYDIPEGRGFADVDASQTVALTIASVDQTLPSHHVVLPESATPVFFRRRFIQLNPETHDEQHGTVHCIGWKRDAQEVYLFVFEDGSALLTDDLQAV